MRTMNDTEKEYDRFSQARSEYEKWMEGETTRGQRIASVRIEATYSLRNWALGNGEVSQDECYKSYLRLVDAWFSYEALLLLAEEIYFTAHSSSKPERLLKSEVPNIEMVDIVRGFYADLSETTNKPNRKDSLQKYVQTLMGYPGTSASQRHHLSQFNAEIKKGKFTGKNYSRILAFVYAIRNAYAHNGETARTGTEHYRSKLIILTASYNFTLRFVLRTATLIYEELISGIS